MRACNVDLEKLRRELDNVVTHGSVEAEPTEGDLPPKKWTGLSGF
jgi:hypothetical protein